MPSPTSLRNRSAPHPSAPRPPRDEPPRTPPRQAVVTAPRASAVDAFVAPSSGRRSLRGTLAEPRVPVESAITAALEQGRLSKTAAQVLDLDAPHAHPEWPRFQEAFLALGMGAEGVERVWEQTLKGVKHQEHLSAAGKPDRANPFFARVAQAVAPFLKIEQGRGPLALWSGGYDVSKYAQQQGYSTLESTPAGRVFAALELYKDPGAVVPLWDHLSEQFVKQNAQGPAHVFLRTHDPLSTLYQREAPALTRLDPDRGVTWHPLHGDRHDTLQEIRPDLTLGAWGGYSSEQEARRVLKRHGTHTRDEGRGATTMKLP
jgi:hypothetical protein